MASPATPSRTAARTTAGASTSTPTRPFAPTLIEYNREHLVREKLIQKESAKIIHDQLFWCYRIEGVNHHQKCHRLVDQYLEATRGGVDWGKDARPTDDPPPHSAPRLYPLRFVGGAQSKKAAEDEEHWFPLPLFLDWSRKFSVAGELHRRGDVQNDVHDLHVFSDAGKQDGASFVHAKLDGNFVRGSKSLEL
ncbi:hypothetical protein ABZP36_013653 [Zizania latifolia]